MQQIIDLGHNNAIAEFKRRNPNIKQWNQLMLAEAKSARMIDVQIDGTMQRELDIQWVLKIVNQFLATMVVPIQVYRDPTDPSKYIAWDGQHTLLALWVVANIVGADPATIEIPVNVYQSSLKAQMRGNFLSLNSAEGKKALEAIDHWIQQIYGVRLDGSTNPQWVATELKQKHLETNGLFATSKKFGDEDQVGAVSRLQEINKLSIDAVGHLARYLNNVISSTAAGRPVDEKEMVMMAHYFHRAEMNGIKIDNQYVDDLSATTCALFNADFSPEGPFWLQVKTAYENWHATQPVYNTGIVRCKKEPLHGFPFLVAQLNKSFLHRVPMNDSNSGFYPDSNDLF
jgi:hypothetical protein